MKKFLIILCVLIGFVACFFLGSFLSDITSQKEILALENEISEMELQTLEQETLQNEPYNIDFNQSSLYAIALLGYQFEDVDQITANGADYISLSGDEYFLFVPRYTDMEIEIYEDSFENEAILIYSSKSSRPFVIKGNQSDIFPNIVIKITTAQGISTEVSPYISLKDGSLEINEYGVILEDYSTIWQK